MSPPAEPPSSGPPSTPPEAPPAPAPRRRRRGWLIVLGAAVILGVILIARRPHAPQKGAPAGHGATAAGPKPVVPAVATTRDVPVSIVGLGAVTPTYSVTVRTRVDGQLLYVAFEEGQDVKKGDVLAQLDPRPFQVELDQARGQLARDKALLENARIDLRRYTALVAEDSIAEQTLATQRALVLQYEGAVKTDQGAVDSARLNLTYTRITAPVSGRVGLRLVDPGNIVNAASTTGLVILNTVQPIAVVFSVPEDHVPQIMAKLRARQPLEVRAYDRAGQRLLSTGTLLAADNQVDPNTGTLRLKGSFPNHDLKLFPQQFVNASLIIDTLRNATLVPTAALQHGTHGTFVYVIQSDDTVQSRPVTTGPSDGDDTVITQGVHPGETVVVEGADNLTGGSRIRRQAPTAQGPHVGGGGASPGSPGVGGGGSSPGGPGPPDGAP
ncbi:MdtA/MuxA family multidrug efflux RND transporter periplasmic adaptor subunit [Myxococcus stipitatus]|uniref:MdtA/MuxA family multidrug efflux RND transporter periplasmic adaptor subunit n=1 Tax=Myxococcus stipitatus TaxID=83455 RepID=UPI0030CF4039